MAFPALWRHLEKRSYSNIPGLFIDFRILDNLYQKRFRKTFNKNKDFLLIKMF